MKNISLFKIFILLFISNFFESLLAPFFIILNIIVPITFLVFSFIVYSSRTNLNAITSFVLGIYVDLISDSFFGLNAILFSLSSFVINSYSNTFKLFSYLQICFFFGISSTFYIGFLNLFINVQNFSYPVLFVSFIFNTFLCLILSMSKFYIPNLSINNRI